jgi:hypothetical protein
MSKQKNEPNSEKRNGANSNVILTLTLSGQRENLSTLLEQMNMVGGFSVISGSFTQYSKNQSSNQQ